jgi:hypothetical protein
MAVRCLLLAEHGERCSTPNRSKAAIRAVNLKTREGNQHGCYSWKVVAVPQGELLDSLLRKYGLCRRRRLCRKIAVIIELTLTNTNRQVHPCAPVLEGGPWPDDFYANRRRRFAMALSL